MADQMSRRFWVVSALGAVFSAMFVATLLVPDWIEVVFRIDPDGGGGSLEWVFVAVTGVLALSCWVAARLEWRARTA